MFLVALGLSADAFAVALGKGLQMHRLSVRGLLALAVLLGLFQGVMPVLGWVAATTFDVRGQDHWR